MGNGEWGMGERPTSNAEWGIGEWGGSERPTSNAEWGGDGRGRDRSGNAAMAEATLEEGWVAVGVQALAEDLDEGLEAVVEGVVEQGLPVGRAALESGHACPFGGQFLV